MVSNGVSSKHMKEKTAFAIVVAVLIGLNLFIFVSAYPETMVVDSGCCAPSSVKLVKDFSAFYTAAWRLFHDPSAIYTPGILKDGEYLLLPQPEAFKYLPSFLLMISPLLLLPYQGALTAFDIIQFLMLPLIAILLYGLLRGRGLLKTTVVAAAVLLFPLPFLSPQFGMSLSYYWQWAEGQSKVLDTFLLLSSFYLAKVEKPRLSGVVFALGAFDPRFALLGLPLLAAYSTKLRQTLLCAVGTFVLLNLPLLYPQTAAGFLNMVLSSGISTPPSWYDFIPTAALASLMLIDRKEIGTAFKRMAWNSGLG